MINIWKRLAQFGDFLNYKFSDDFYMGVTLAPLGPGFPHFAVLRGSFLHFVYAFISYASFRKKTRKQTDGLRVLQSLTREFLLLKNSRKFIKKCENAIIPPATSTELYFPQFKI